VNVWDTFCFGRAVTCDLWPVTWVSCLPRADLGWDRLAWFGKDKLVWEQSELKLILTCNIYLSSRVRATIFSLFGVYLATRNTQVEEKSEGHFVMLTRCSMHLYV